MIYLDNASTTRVYDELKQIADKYYFDTYFNPSSPFNLAQNLHNDLNEAKETLAKLLNCKREEIFFTSCATESNNAIIYGAVNNNKGNIITTTSEHASVYNCFVDLKNKGQQVDFCPIDPKTGEVDYDEFIKLLNDKTKFVSIMLVNNETGAVNNIKRLVQLTREIAPKAKFHTDAVQAFTKIPIDVKDLDVDFLSFSGHKFHSPKGCGGMYIKSSCHIPPIIHGGGQEKGQRSGTENIPGIMCMAKAAEITNSNMEKNHQLYVELADYLIKEFTNNTNCIINRFNNYVPSILNIAFKGIRGEVLVHSLEAKGVYVSTGSACSSSLPKSRAVVDLKLPREYSDGVIRISFGSFNTLEEIKEASKIIIEEVNALYKAQN